MRPKAKAVVTTRVKVTRADGTIEIRESKQPVTRRVAKKLKELIDNG